MKKFIILATSFLSIISNIVSVGIDNHGAWHGVDADSQHIFDKPLSSALVEFFKSENVNTLVDFGCGMGDYVKTFIESGINCEGYDGNPETPILSKGIASILDLSQSFDLGKKYDWVMSLEVGEHIPAIYETTFIQNLDKHNIKGIVLSWAVKGQGGYGHFNEQSNDYIKNIMQNLGYVNDVDAEMLLRSKSSLPWFKNTIMVFRKK